MNHSKPNEALKFRTRKIKIVVAVCPKCGKDMWKKKTFSKTIKKYICMSCSYEREV